METEDLVCMNVRQGNCQGPVELHITPNREDGQGFPRCSHHWGERMDRYYNSMERYAHVTTPPEWFDPGYAGESWDED